MTLLHKLIVINGIYDVICGLSILKILPLTLFAELHSSLYYSRVNKEAKRFMAYWIITYGFIRILSVPLTPISFYIQALCFMNELWKGNMRYTETIYFVTSSFGMGILSTIYKKSMIASG
jgi:hypothetical protein|tara:strand:+ start:10777 stop:11136 length:360 start_codon:yes stop_codon:yes gene_type:complete